MTQMTPTWYRRPSDDTLVLVLSVEDGMDDFEVAVVEMTVDLAKALLNRLDLVATWHKIDKDLQNAQFWDYTPDYFAASYEEADGDLAPRPLWEAKGEYDGRTDTDMLEVGQSGYVEWCCYVKNTDIRLSTGSLSREDLEKFVGGGQPWPLSLVEQEQQDRIAKATFDA